MRFHDLAQANDESAFARRRPGFSACWQKLPFQTVRPLMAARCPLRLLELPDSVTVRLVTFFLVFLVSRIF